MIESSNGDEKAVVPTEKKNSVLKIANLDYWRKKFRDIVARFSDFSVDKNRASDYLKIPWNYSFTADYEIPIGTTDKIGFQGYVEGGTVDRRLWEYQSRLFLNESDFQQALLNKQTVVDLGSARAIALMELSIMFPNMAMIGLDILYSERRKVFPQKKGLQLSQSNWNDLSILPANSVDLIMSCQAITMWGIPGEGLNHQPLDSGKTWIKILSELHRILKIGGEFRFDIGDAENLIPHLGKQWQIIN